MSGSHTSRENNSINRRPMRRIRSHSAVEVHVIPLRDLCHLRPVCCLSQSLDFLLGRLVLGCRACEFEGGLAAAGLRVSPDARGREACRIASCHFQCDIGLIGRCQEVRSGRGLFGGAGLSNDITPFVEKSTMMRRMPRGSVLQGCWLRLRKAPTTSPTSTSRHDVNWKHGKTSNKDVLRF